MQPQPNIIIAFDPSIVDTGFAVVRGRRLICSGVIRLKSSDPVPLRLALLMDKAEDLLSSYRPAKCLIEKAPHFSYERSTNRWSGKELNFKDILKNGYATAILLALGAKYCSSVLELEAHLWKKIQGRSMGKNEMILFAMQMCPELKTKKLSSHEAEAVCMAMLNC